MQKSNTTSEKMQLANIARSNRLKAAWAVAKANGTNKITSACFSLKNILKVAKVLLTFTKKDGTQSTHEATKNETLIPTEMMPKGVRASSETVLTFFSTTANAWRSIASDLLHTAKWSVAI
jgi:hypothetical protein